MRHHLALLALAFVACTNKSQQSPNPAPPGSGQPAVTEVGTPTNGMATSAMIGPEGGRIASSDGRLTLIVPPSAVSAPTQFGVQPITNQAPGGVGVAYRITPDGQTFATPATIAFAYGDQDVLGTTADALSIGYQDPTAHTWRVYDAPDLDENGHRVQVKSAHLSDWTMLEGFNLRPPTSQVDPGKTVTFSVKLCATTDPLGIPGGGSTSAAADCNEMTEDDELKSPVKFTNWSVNGAPGGTTGTGMIARVDDYHAVYTAPMMRPSPNPVTISAQTAWKGKVTTVVAQVYVNGTDYHVDATFKMNTPICNLGTGDVTDHFSFDLDIASGTASNIQNDDDGVMNAQPLGGATSITVDAPPDEFTMSGVSTVENDPGTPRKVVLAGQTKPGACTAYYGPSPIHDPGTAPEGTTVSFTLDESRFDQNTTSVQVDSDVNLGKQWKLTITRAGGQ